MIDRQDEKSIMNLSIKTIDLNLAIDRRIDNIFYGNINSESREQRGFLENWKGQQDQFEWNT